MSGNKITILDQEITPLEYKGQRVLTFAMIDKVHGRPEGTAYKRFNDNRERFVEGEDYFSLSYEEVKQTSDFRMSGIVPNPKGLIVVTESGYLLLVKAFTDDRAWQVQKMLVKTYFAVREMTYMEIVAATANAYVEAERRAAAQDRRIGVVEHKVETVETKIDTVQKTLAEEQDNQMVTVLGFCRIHNIPATDGQLSVWGRKLTAIAKRNGVKLGQTHHAKYGYANTYPKWLLTKVFTELGLV